MSVSIASEQSAVAARTGKPFTFTRKRGSAEDEFFPGAGSTLHFANRDTDTFTARGVPAGLLQPGDEVTVKYNNATVFKGEVSRILDRHGRGDERTQDVTVSGPWDQLGRLVFKQTWGNQTVNFSSSRVILGQTAAGAAQTMAAQIAEIATYAAQYCDMALASSDNHAPSMCLPLDEARDITCADAIRRELRFFPKLVVRFDYSSGTPALQIVDPAHADTASYMASIPMTDREYAYNAHPVKYVDVTVDAVEIAVNGDAASFHQEYPAIPSGTSPLDILHVTIPLAKGGGSTTSESFKIETEPLPGQSDSPYVDLNDKNWWKAKHPRLENVVANDIAISNGARSDSGETNVYQRILKNAKDEVEAAGKHCRFTRFTCKCTITTTDYEEEDIFLSMDFLTTDATTRTYTVQTGSTATAGEELPAGLAQALYEQRSQSLVSEAVTVRLGASFPKLGDKLVETVGNATETLYLQSFDVDCYDLTARLSFGQPEHLSAEDMKSLLNGFRQRGSASTAVLREQKGAEEGEEPDAPGGIPPIASSEWAPGKLVKTVLKKTAANRSVPGAINLDSTEVPNGETMGVKTLTLPDNTEVQILATGDVTIPTVAGAPGEDGEDGVGIASVTSGTATSSAGYTTTPVTVTLTDGTTQSLSVVAKDGNDASLPSQSQVDVITGLSFSFDNGQLKATLKKKTLTFYGTASAETEVSDKVGLPLYQHDVVIGSAYDDSANGTHKFTNSLAPGVVAGSASPSTTTDDVFTSTAHSAE